MTGSIKHLNDRVMLPTTAIWNVNTFLFENEPAINIRFDPTFFQIQVEL